MEIAKFKRSAANTTLAEAIEWVEEHMDDGAECPCCGQLAKVYKRKLNSAMAFVLLLLHRRKADEEWVHVPSYINAQVLDPTVSAAVRGDWAKLVHWGFLEAMDGLRADGSKRIGYYKITRNGRLFVTGQIKAPKHVWFYNGGPTEDVDTEMVSIVSVLGDRFDYAQLMRGEGK